MRVWSGIPYPLVQNWFCVCISIRDRGRAEDGTPTALSWLQISEKGSKIYMTNDKVEIAKKTFNWLNY